MRVICLLLVFVVMSAPALAAGGPDAGARTYGDNYKDMVLAECITAAYRSAALVAKDAGSSAAALSEWTNHDIEQATPAIRQLIAAYLARDYTNPLAETEQAGIRYDLLKCFDLYHSQALAAQVKRYVGTPKRRFRQDQSRQK